MRKQTTNNVNKTWKATGGNTYLIAFINIPVYVRMYMYMWIKDPNEKKHEDIKGIIRSRKSKKDI
jgi:hypothetical protein